MSGTIRLYHSELPVHTFALGVCSVTIRLLHSWAVTLPTVNGTSDLFTGGSFEERSEYITIFVTVRLHIHHTSIKGQSLQKPNHYDKFPFSKHT